MKSNAQILAQGETFHGPTKTLPTSGYSAASLAAEGQEVAFKDSVTGRLVYGRIMRNVSGITVYGGRAVANSTTAELHKKRFIGYAGSATFAAAAAGIVDPLLVTTGCRNHDLCIVYYSGPCDCMPDTTADTAAVPNCAIGDWVVGMTGLSTTPGSTALTAGQFYPFALAGAFGTTNELTDGRLSRSLANKWGVIMEACTTAHRTGRVLRLVDLDIR